MYEEVYYAIAALVVLMMVANGQGQKPRGLGAASTIVSIRSAFGLMIALAGSVVGLVIAPVLWYMCCIGFVPGLLLFGAGMLALSVGIACSRQPLPGRYGM